MDEKSVRIRYGGSVFWLVFWAILFFPVALVLLLTSGKFEMNGRAYYIRYSGSVFWLGFWTIFMFPVAILLAFVNGLNLTVSDRERLIGP